MSVRTYWRRVAIVITPVWVVYELIAWLGNVQTMTYLGQ